MSIKVRQNGKYLIEMLIYYSGIHFIAWIFVLQANKNHECSKGILYLWNMEIQFNVSVNLPIWFWESHKRKREMSDRQIDMLHLECDSMKMGGFINERTVILRVSLIIITWRSSVSSPSASLWSPPSSRLTSLLSWTEWPGLRTGPWHRHNIRDSWTVSGPKLKFPIKDDQIQILKMQ